MPNHEELFLQDEPTPQPGQSETPPPLRINKQHSGSSQPSADEPLPASKQWAQYRVPPSSAFGAPTSPPPTGPLPYPDERSRTQAQSRPDGQKPPSRTTTPQTMAAEEGRGPGPMRPRKSSMSSDASSGAGSSAGGPRARFNANDPARPTLGYGASPPPIQTSRLADRRGTPTKNIATLDSPGGPEPPPKSDEDDGLFAVRPNRKPSEDTRPSFYPPPLGAAPPAPSLTIPNPAGVNRLDSTASTSTTRASRGSPPPPETPVGNDQPPPSEGGLGDIEARYAASGIPGASTLTEMQAQSAAAAARRAHYGPQPPRQGGSAAQTPQPTSQQQQNQSTSGNRWSPTEQPGVAPHGPPIRFQGIEEVNSRGESVPPQDRPRQGSYPRPTQASPTAGGLEGDMNRMNLHEEPPPAYSPPAPGTLHSPYPNEKGRYAEFQNPTAGASDSGRQPGDPSRQHPAFANDQPSAQPSPAVASLQQQNSQRASPAALGVTPLHVPQANQTVPQAASPPNAGPASPPPLPEGWIAHLDNSSGQYYYIHLPTQSTQWEFPKGPTPLNLQEPTSPIGTFQSSLVSPVGTAFKYPLASPTLSVQQMANYERLSMATISSPTATGFTGPPPSAGVDMYKVAPSNGVYFGPYLRYTNIDLERGLWLGSILLITDAATQPPTIHIHQSVDLSPDPRQLKANPIQSHQRWVFYRYDVDLRMDENDGAKWTYAITSHLGCTRYEFLVAGRRETSWRFVAHSGNDFALNVSANDRSKLGGVQLMWKDILLKHQECGGFHTQIGLGGQISADRLWKDIPALKQWTQISGKDNRRTAQWTPKMEEDVTHAYFHYYTSHFDQPAMREAFAQIPHICCLDDQDIFDGYGSYPEYMQQSHVFKNLGRIGIEMYLLFQHHTTPEILRNVSNDIDLFTITGQGWHFLKYLGPSVVIVGPDTRSERNTTQVMAGPTYQGLFPKVAVLPPSVQHCIWLLPVPIVYPRLEGIEQVANTFATGKKVVTGGFNMIGKVAGGVAGVVGAKGMVNQGFDGVKKAMGKSGLMAGVLSPFGEVDMLDELRDMWTHESKDLERTYLIRTLQGIAHNKSLRMTFLSGSVNSCGAGIVHDPSHPSDHKTMYQLITSAVVDGPAPGYVIKLLHNNKPLYIPMNGHRSTPSQPSDTKEEMMEIFAADVDGRPRDLRRLMGRRNYLACVVYNPELIQSQFGSSPQTPGPQKAGGQLSLAADFMVQAEGAFGQPLKYGPVIIPSLEYGR